MDKQDYYHSQSMLRELLRKLGEGDFRTRVKYRFALQFNPMFGFYHLWDGMLDDPKCVATIRLRPKNTLVRYDPDWLFLPQLMKLQLPDRKTLFIPSDNTNRHEGWVSSRVQSRINRRVAQRRTFLGQESNSGRSNSPQLPFTVRVQLSPALRFGRTTTASSTLSGDNSSLISVGFATSSEAAEMVSQVQSMAERMAGSFGYEFAYDDYYSWDDFVQAYYGAERLYEDIQVRERALEQASRRRGFATVSPRSLQDYVQEFNPNASWGLDEINAIQNMAIDRATLTSPIPDPAYDGAMVVDHHRGHTGNVVGYDVPQMEFVPIDRHERTPMFTELPWDDSDMDMD